MSPKPIYMEILTSRLGMMDSVPQSPNPNLTRTGSPATSTPERAGSPIKGLTYSKAAAPVQAETSTISAKGENGLWDDDEAGPSVGGKGSSSRARRELSVIDESSSIAQGNEEESAVEVSSDAGLEANVTGPLVDERRDTEDELDETEEEELPHESRVDGDGADDGVSEKLEGSVSNPTPAVPA
jgi:hypothetical protein